jgi:hypothetical protein
VFVVCNVFWLFVSVRYAIVLRVLGRDGGLIVARRDGVGWEKGVSAMVEHRYSELAHERFCL